MTIEVFNSAIVLIDGAANLGADYASPVIDFRDCNAGCIHVIYQGVDVFNSGTFTVHGGLSRIPADMDDNDISFSDFKPIKAAGSRLWEYTRLTWRYGQLRWTHGSVAAGTAKILARGQKF